LLDREFFLGFVKIHILYHASKEPIFGIGISQELAHHGYSLSPGVLYPTLRRLKADGYLEQSMKVVDGKKRKYYTTTEQGKAVLREASAKIASLVAEVLEENGGSALSRKQSRRKLTE
jgi:PadR family transcriptional regulator PadR